jgi:hypothetical protein
MNGILLQPRHQCPSTIEGQISQTYSQSYAGEKTQWGELVLSTQCWLARLTTAIRISAEVREPDLQTGGSTAAMLLRSSGGFLGGMGNENWTEEWTTSLG